MYSRSVSLVINHGCCFVTLSHLVLNVWWSGSTNQLSFCVLGRCCSGNLSIFGFSGQRRVRPHLSIVPHSADLALSGDR